MKEAGVYKGRPASIDAARVRELKAEGLGPCKIAKALGIGRASVYTGPWQKPLDVDVSHSTIGRLW